MPIKGLSEKRRCPRMGHIRLGIKKVTAGGKSYPAEVDYFILDPQTPEEQRNAQLKGEFKQIYGEKPKAIKIMFPPLSPEIFFQQWYKRYGSSSLLKCKGDGETATCILAEHAKGMEITGENEFGQPEVKCLGPKCIYQQKGSVSCAQIAQLQVFLPELSGTGVWQIDTGSSNSIQNINSAIDWLKGICGRYYMIPLTLMRVKTDIQYEGKKSVHYILAIDQNIKLAEIQKLGLVEPERIMLPAPKGETGLIGAIPEPEGDKAPNADKSGQEIEFGEPKEAPAEIVTNQKTKDMQIETLNKLIKGHGMSKVQVGIFIKEVAGIGKKGLEDLTIEQLGKLILELQK